MILTEYVEIKVNVNNIKNLIDFGYTNLKIGLTIEIKTEHLSKGSHALIDVKCDVCGKERYIMYKEYLRNLKQHNYYSCKGKCSSEKNRLTNLEKYGEDYFLKTEESKSKIKLTNLKKYGVDNPMKSDKIKEKFKFTMKQKYGVDNPSFSDELKNKRKKTMNEKFGVDYYVLHRDFKQKSEQTFMINFGTNHPMKIREEVRKRLMKRGLDFETDKFRIYRSKVDYLTSKNKKILYDSWDGFDFYDDEFILENLQLSGQHGDYPTIDHKKSVKECFDEGILPVYVADLDNLCITKRRINSKKHMKYNFTL